MYTNITHTQKIRRKEPIFIFLNNSNIKLFFFFFCFV